MADGVCGSISTGVGHGRVRGGMDELRGEVARHWAQQIEAGWRGLAGATNDGGSSSSLRYANSRKEKVADGTGSFEASAWLRAALNAEVGRDCRRVDALAGDHSGGMGVGAQYRAQERHCLLVY